MESGRSRGRNDYWQPLLRNLTSLRRVASARIRNFRWHDLRHTSASWFVKRGRDLYKLSRIFGRPVPRRQAVAVQTAKPGNGIEPELGGSVIGPNKALQATAYSARSCLAPASGRSLDSALAGCGCIPFRRKPSELDHCSAKHVLRPPGSPRSVLELSTVLARFRGPRPVQRLQPLDPTAHRPLRVAPQAGLWPEPTRGRTLAATPCGGRHPWPPQKLALPGVLSDTPCVEDFIIPLILTTRFQESTEVDESLLKSRAWPGGMVT